MGSGKVSWIRRMVQIIFLGWIGLAAGKYAVAESAGGGGGASGTASIDALCPFGGIETMYTWLTSGEMIPKIHSSNLILLWATLILAVVAGAAFCGWLCPFGTVQEFVYRLRTKIYPKKIMMPEFINRYLPLMRYVVLIWILIATATTSTMVFADYDPYRALMRIFNDEVAVAGVVILIIVLIGSMIWDRFWCRFACPLGAVLGLFNRISFIKISRNERVCVNCGLCSKACTQHISVENRGKVSATTCTRCLECIDVCPKKGALFLETASLPWFDNSQKATEV